MGNPIDLKKFSADEFSDEMLSELISEKASFQIVDVKHIGTVVKRLERAIEGSGLKCRVYTEYRSAAVAGAALVSGLLPVVGISSVIGIAAHNIATYGPDYEIAKNKPVGRVNVIYKK